MGLQPHPSGSRSALLRAAELGSWGAALFFVVPPVPSMAGEVYSPTRAIVAGVAALGIHFGIKIWKQEERLYLVVLKIAMFAGLIWVSYKRASL